MAVAVSDAAAGVAVVLVDAQAVNATAAATPVAPDPRARLIGGQELTIPLSTRGLGQARERAGCLIWSA